MPTKRGGCMRSAGAADHKDIIPPRMSTSTFCPHRASCPVYVICISLQEQIQRDYRPVQMAQCQSSVDDDVSDFFERCGLPRNTRSRCLDLSRRIFPNEETKETEPQGYCSYTLCVGRDTIVQFRPTVHKLDVRVTDAARTIYGSLAPRTKLLDVIDVSTSCSPDDVGGHSYRQPVDEAVVIDDGCDNSHSSLHVYSLSRIPGVSVTELRASWAQSSSPAAELRRQRKDVVSEFARFITLGWKSARSASDSAVSSLRGRIGGSIRWRLQEMRAHLPARFQPSVRDILDRLGDIEALPWVLTHGDVVPANMVVQKSQSPSPGGLVLSGFLDWAEAEYLPFGVGIYGLEALLGEAAHDGRFGYYPEAQELRDYFWLRLEAEIPELRPQIGPEGFRKNVEAAHTLGVLLWHGIAFDNGRLDRVVDEGKLEDAEEVRILDLFFALKEESRDERVTSGHRVEPDRDSLVKPLDLSRVFSDIWTCIRHLSFGDRHMGRSY